MRTLLGHITLLLLAGLLWACGGDRAMQQTLDRAEALMEEHPDSAFNILQHYDSINTGSEEQRARFAVLYSMALDKNYKDTANFNVLQPALDYYPTHGTDADKIRTLYYEGRIYQNAGRMDEAMQAWAEGLQYRGPKTDSLVLAHLLVAQGNEYYRLYKFDKYVDNNRQAEEIYRAIGRKDFADKAFLYQFELFLSVDSVAAKKSIGRVAKLALDSLSPHAELARSKALQYEMHFGTSESLDARIKKYKGYPIDSLDLTQALLNLRRISEAEKVFQSTHPDRDTQIKYLLRKLRLEKAKGNFEEALASSEKLLQTFDRKQSAIIEEDRQFAEERFQWSSAVEKHKRAWKNAWIFSAVSLFVVLLLAIILYLKLKNSRTKKALLEEKTRRLEIEKQNRELEIERINHQLLEIEEEKATLENLVKTASIIPKSVTERLFTLNSLIPLIASGNRSKLAEAIETLMADRNKFLQDTRMGLAATHPGFIMALEEKGLSDEEIEYLCLYAIGFTGKEAGNLLGRKAYYNLSGDIRKKLGLQSGTPYLSQVVRELMSI